MYFFFIHSTDSTQNHAKALSELHSAHVPFWAQSGWQTHGRGQRGRTWDSKPGNIYLTGCFVRPQGVTPGQLSIGIGVSLAGILQSVLPDNPIGLKWPNDLLLNKQKCAGILIEMNEHVYLGIGINVASHPDSTPMPATHIHAWGQVDANSLIAEIVEAIPDFKALENFTEIQQKWWKIAKDSVPDWCLREPLNGEVVGIDEHGQLSIKSPQGEITLRHQTFVEG